LILSLERPKREEILMVSKPDKISTARVGELIRDGDTDQLIANPRVVDEFNQSIVKEFPDNRGRVGGPSSEPVNLPMIFVVNWTPAWDEVRKAKRNYF
jgi:hypothetical protein